MLSRELIDELKQILKKNYGLTLSLAETDEIGTSLVGYFTILARMQSENDTPERNDNEKPNDYTPSVER